MPRFLFTCKECGQYPDDWNEGKPQCYTHGYEFNKETIYSQEEYNKATQQGIQFALDEDNSFRNIVLEQLRKELHDKEFIIQDKGVVDISDIDDVFSKYSQSSPKDKVFTNIHQVCEEFFPNDEVEIKLVPKSQSGKGDKNVNI